MNTPERDLVLQWFEARAKENLAWDELRRAEKVLEEAKLETKQVEQRLYEITPEKSTRLFYIKALGKFHLVEVHRQRGMGGLDGVYDKEVEDLG
jgi:hypothetical protein